MTDRSPIPGDDRPILVVGLGNRLCRDDAVGPMAAEAVALLGRPGVVPVAVHQLLPELAEPLSGARLAIFVDARVGGGGPAAALAVSPVGPSEHASSALGHTSDPATLLALARDVFGACPRAWLVTVPATDLGLGEGLSPSASAGLSTAIRAINALLDDEGIAAPAPERSPGPDG